MTVPDHKYRTPEQIVSEHIYHDAQGFSFRAASWIHLAKSSGNFAAFHYACIDARLAIEHLIFEQLVLTAGNTLTREAYQKCVAQPRKLDRMLDKLVPDYERLQEFTDIVAALSQSIPKINRWDVRALRRSWGKLSRYLHWSGAHSETTENTSWQADAIAEVALIIEPLWQKVSSGHSGCIQPDSMPSSTREVWEEFRTGAINREIAETRLRGGAAGS